MMKQTANLRFIKRQVDKDVHRILQQQWIDDDPPDEGAIRYAWRDVPIAEEQDAQVDSGREEIARIIAPGAFDWDIGTTAHFNYETAREIAYQKADAIIALSGGRGA